MVLWVNLTCNHKKPPVTLTFVADARFSIMLANAKQHHFLCLFLCGFLIARVPFTLIPDGLPEALENIIDLVVTQKFLLYVMLGLLILIFIKFSILLCSNCYFIPFNVSLNMLRKKTKLNHKPFTSLLLSYSYIAVLFTLYQNEVGSVVPYLDNHVILDSLIFRVILFSIRSYNAITNLGLDLSQIILHNYSNIYPWCHSHELSALWLFALLIILSSDVHPNPGPLPVSSEFANGFLSFCNWNLNTLSKDNFSRVSLLQAHNTICKYDIISLCETSLNDDIQVPEGILPGYLYHPLNHPDGKKSGGVGLFY